jgi:vitamin B12 transporter
MLVDGIQVNDPGGDFNFAHLMTADIDRIEIVRGPQSAIYGSNAAAAVIQIVSRQGSLEDGPASGYGSIEGGSFSTYRYRTGVSGLIRSLDYSLAAERLHTLGAYPNDSYRNLTFAANAGYRTGSNSQLRLTLRTIDSRVGLPNRVGYSLLDLDAFRTGAHLISGARYEHHGRTFSQKIQLGFTRHRDYFRDDFAQGPFTIGAILRGTPGARGSGAVRLLQFLTAADLASGTFEVPADARLVRRTITLAPTAPSRQTTQRRSGEYQANWDYSNGRSVILGYAIDQERGSSGTVAPLRNNHGLFANHQHRIGERLFLTESVRLEDNSVFGRKATPRLAASYLLTPAVRLKASAGTGITAPSFLQNFANDPAFVGNPDLRPERSQSIEAGVEHYLFGRALTASATWFGNRFRDLIVFSSVPPPQRSTWVNLESSRAQGVEFAADFRKAWLAVRGQYTFLNTRVTASASPASASTGVGQELPRRPRHSGGLRVTGSFPRAAASLNVTFVGERQDSDGIGFGVVRNPRYQRVDLGGSYVLNRWADIFVRIENLLNRRYEEVLGYTALRRNVLAGIKLKWGRR